MRKMTNCPCNKIKLAGAKFALCDCEGRTVACGVTNSCGEIVFDCLPFGKYYLRELEAPCGYTKCDEVVEVCISECSAHECVEFVNVKKTGSIKVVKFGKTCT